MTETKSEFRWTQHFVRSYATTKWIPNEICTLDSIVSPFAMPYVDHAHSAHQQCVMCVIFALVKNTENALIRHNIVCTFHRIARSSVSYCQVIYLVLLLDCLRSGSYVCICGEFRCRAEFNQCIGIDKTIKMKACVHRIQFTVSTERNMLDEAHQTTNIA